MRPIVVLNRTIESTSASMLKKHLRLVALENKYFDLRDYSKARQYKRQADEVLVGRKAIMEFASMLSKRL